MSKLKKLINGFLYGKSNNNMGYAGLSAGGDPVEFSKTRSNEPMTTITKDALIGDILDAHPEVAPHLLAMGMHCLGCPSARGESLEQACMVHGVNVDELLEKMNADL